MEILNNDVIRYSLLSLPLHDFRKIYHIFLCDKRYRNIIDEKCIENYVSFRYQINKDRYLPGYFGKQMADFCQKILDKVYSQGTIVSVNSFTNLFHPLFLERLEKYGPFNGNRPHVANNGFDYTLAEKIMAHIFDSEGLRENSVTYFSGPYDIIVNMTIPIINKEIYISSLKEYLTDNYQGCTFPMKDLFLEIFKHLFFQHTEYFSHMGIINLPFNIEIYAMKFIDSNNKEIISLDNDIDLYDSGKIIDRDDLDMAINHYIEKSNVELGSNDEYRKMIKNNRQLCLQFINLPFIPNPEILKLINTFKYTYTQWCIDEYMYI